MAAGAYQPGEKCDRYRIVRLIASGGSGEVYEAVHEFTGRTVALKCLLLKLAHRDDLKDRMRLEAVVLCRIRHANVVSVHDAGITDDGTVWIAMELLEGQTLRALLKQGRQPIALSLYYAAAIADGVEAAHELHVVHRDLKPENVFVTARNEVKVLDLGTAKFHGYGLKTTDRMRMIGTPAYMSPEHLRGETVDVRADVYSLGVMSYELFAGRHPFAPQGDALPDPFELGAMHLYADPPPLSARIAGFPEPISQLVQTAMHKDRAKRFPSMAQFAAAAREARTWFLRSVDPVSGQLPQVPHSYPPPAHTPPGLSSQPTPAYPAALPLSGSQPPGSVRPAAPSYPPPSHAENAAPALAPTHASPAAAQDRPARGAITVRLGIAPLAPPVDDADTEPLMEAQHAATEPAFAAPSMQSSSPKPPPAARHPDDAAPGVQPVIIPASLGSSVAPAGAPLTDGSASMVSNTPPASVIVQVPRKSRPRTVPRAIGMGMSIGLVGGVLLFGILRAGQRIGPADEERVVAATASEPITVAAALSVPGPGAASAAASEPSSRSDTPMGSSSALEAQPDSGLHAGAIPPADAGSYRGPPSSTRPRPATDDLPASGL